MSVDDRSAYIKQKQLCLNCFANGHQLHECKSTHNCFTCRGRHHTLLHRNNPFSSNSSPSNPARPISANQANFVPNEQAGVQNKFATGSRAILLGTAVINISHLGTNFKARALIDSGSEATFVTERLFNLIRLPFQVVQAQVSGLNQTVQEALQLHHPISD
ncbi:uncharacterized protein LOC122319505 [Drosophila yakuba]|uniref:uncharacterized protein LOC122319505 n=1 Tax=Drosophila yakuba TaxID=7245 RepID=UPI001C8AD7AB|nr:uncharacterized protein LOC122319505 [Drosophila yakuba]